MPAKNFGEHRGARCWYHQIPIHVHALSPHEDWTQQLWPISGNTVRSSLFLVEIFGGNSKPMDAHESMGLTINQLKVLLRNSVW